MSPEPSVFTLRRSNFEETLNANQSFAKILIGGNSPVHNKADKEHLLWVPSQLYRKIQIYLASERAKIRLEKSSFRESSIGSDEYVFLTKYGNPYYIARKDPAFANFFHPPRGNAIHKFISSSLRPLTMRCRESFSFKFHDLRATFGMNLVESYFKSEANTKEGPDYFRIFTIVQQRMGHSDLKTTEAYLNCPSSYNLSQISAWAKGDFAHRVG